jgi:hypothetical protein
MEAARIARLIADLDHDDFDTRQKASKELDRLAPANLPALRKALARPASLEAYRRLERILARHPEGRLSPDELRTLRAVHALEEAGLEARFLLRKLAGGAPDALLTRDARAALARLERN